MMLGKKRLPDFRLKGLNKVTSRQNELGVGWSNEDGSISITINEFIQVPNDRDVIITLFPVESKTIQNNNKT